MKDEREDTSRKPPSVGSADVPDAAVAAAFGGAGGGHPADRPDGGDAERIPHRTGVGLMPSWAEGKSNKEIQKINTEIQRLCKQDNFEYVDVFDKLIGEDGQLSREYTVDGIHLQENAYDVVAAIIYHLMEG